LLRCGKAALDGRLDAISRHEPGNLPGRRSAATMDAFFKPLAPFWKMIGHNPFMSALACAAIAGLAALLNSGHILALFACLGSMIIMYKVEADHAAQGLDLPAAPLA
jgi:hypothetical protein